MPRPSRTSVAVVIAAASIVILGVIVIRLPSLQVREIGILGLQTIDEGAVRAHVLSGIAGSRFLLLPQSSYFLADTDALADDLRAAFPAVAEARIEKIFPRSLAVAITERTFWGIVCNTLQEAIPLQCAALDTTGYAYEPAPLPQGNLIVMVETDRAELAAGKQQVERQLMARLSALAEGIREATGLEISRFELKERASEEIRARVADGFMVYFRRDDDFVNAFRVLKKVLDDEIGDRRAELDYIDARFGNKVFYKLKQNE